MVAEARDLLPRGLAGLEHRGSVRDLDLLLNLADNIQGRTICALGDAAAMPVRAFVKTYRSEFEYHIEHKRCQVKPGGYSSPAPAPEKMAAD